VLYLDSSAIAKLYVAEPGSQQVRAAIRSDRLWSTSVAASVEVKAALAAADRAARFPGHGSLTRVLARLRADWPRYFVIILDEPLAELAGELAVRHRLRGYDAVHLASAVAVASETGISRRSFGFGTFDDELRAAAAAEGFRMLF
jgi:predicted nucleic acid-binding protein